MTSAAHKVSFPGVHGQQLAALLDAPSGPVRAYALFAHCFTCGKESLAASRISRELVKHGIAVLRFDFTGLGGSDGDFANTNFSSNVADLVAAARFLRQKYVGPHVLIGHSLGGAAVLAAADEIPEALAVVTIGAPSDPAHLARHFSSSRDEITSRGEAEVKLGGRTFRITKQFLDDIEGHRLADHIGNLKRSLLVLHAPRDHEVGIDNAAAIFTAARHPKSFISLDGADHLLTRPEDATFVANLVAAWASRYAGTTIPDMETSAEGTVRVVESGDSRYSAIVTAGNRHTLRADEPVPLGGADFGPTPYEFLLAALGACTTMTLRMYAERKGIALRRVAVTLSHEKIHASDCKACEAKDGKLDHINRFITIEGDLEEAERQRLLEIADRCPVHRTLTSEVLIETRLTDAL